MLKLINRVCLFLFFPLIVFSFITGEIRAENITLPKSGPIILPVPAIPENPILNITINKPELNYGEKAIVKTTLHNQTEQSLKGTILVIIYPFEDFSSVKTFNYEFDLFSSEKTENLISEVLLEDWMINGKYKVDAEAKDQYGNIFAKKTIFFELIEKNNIGKEIEAEVNICSSENCSNSKTVFGSGDIVYLRLETLNKNIKIKATIKNPNGKIEVLNFAGNTLSYSLNEKESGKYSIWVNLSASGYQGKRLEKEFIFEEDYTEEVFESVCKVNGKCDGEENEINCPKDCNVESGITTKKMIIYSLYFIFVVVVVFVIKKKVIKKNSNKFTQ